MYGIIIIPIINPAAKALSDETVKPRLSPIDLKKGPTVNPLESTTTITTQIVMILVGDQEFDSPKTQAAFALGLTLFVATLFLNYIALRVVKKYREKYE